jgi:CheY-like chemotaxis protein
MVAVDVAVVLIIEDDADTCEVLQRALEARDHQVTCVPNGKEALVKLVGARMPDLIVLDIRMPVMDGITFMQVLRSYLRWQDVPVIVVTAVNEGPDMETIRKYGVLEIFPKARYELSDLVAAVDRAVGAAPPPPPPDSMGPSPSTFDA